MSLKCRILSIFVVPIILSAVIAFIIYIFNKPNTENVYATSIKFTPMASTIEVYKLNELIIDSNIVEVKPSDCSFAPKFTLVKYGQDEAETIALGKLNFATAGKYTLTCSIPSSEKYDIEDSLIISVLDAPDENSLLYITQFDKPTIYVEDSISINSFAKIIYPKTSYVNISPTDNISVNNNIVTALKDGTGFIDITITYDNISIYYKLKLFIKPKLTENNITLTLSLKGEVIKDNTIQLEYSNFSFSLNYEISNLETNQEISCWTTSPLIKVISFDTPVIVLKTLGVGEAIVYISPKAYPDIVFEIVLIIV